MVGNPQAIGLNYSQQAASRSSARGSNPQTVPLSGEGKDTFTWSGALSNYGKGLVSPVTAPISMMMQSPRNFLLGSGLLGAGAMVLLRFGSRISPFLAAGGLLLGAYQAFKGVSSLRKAQGGKEKEEAFQELGAATTTLGLSSLGVGSLKALLPGGKTVAATAEATAQVSQSAKVGNAGVAAHAVVEPLEKWGQFGSLADARGKPGLSEGTNLLA